MSDKGGAPVGNQNAVKARIWSAAVQRALEKRSRAEGIEMIDKLADQLIDLCLAKDLPSLKELGDRLEGKPVQAVSGPDGETFAFIIKG